MTPLQKKFTRAYAKELLRIAEADLATAKVLIDHPGGRPENTLFLIQQTIEKCLKAVLCHSDLPVPLSHDLAALLGMVPESAGVPSDQKAILSLTEFASIRRYEEGKYEYSAGEMKSAYLSASVVVEWAKQIIAVPPAAHSPK